MGLYLMKSIYCEYASGIDGLSVASQVSLQALLTFITLCSGAPQSYFVDTALRRCYSYLIPIGI